jgi:hypothetical protein
MRNVTEKSLLGRVLSAAGLDTAFVLFFLALEYGRAVRALSVDGIMLAITMAMVLVLPYFLPSGLKSSSFAGWIFGRTAVAFAGLAAGAVMGGTLSAQMPSVRLMPMTGLVIAAMVSCYVQFYGLMKLRLAK